MDNALTGQQIADEKLTGWTYFLNRLRTRVATPDFTAGLALVNAIAAEAGRRDHHPGLDLRYTHVGITLTSHDTGGVTGRDVRLARAISALIAEAGLTQEYAGISRIEFGLDTPDLAGLLPFWVAVLGGEAVDGDVRDPYGELPAVWFQRSGSQEPRQHWHPDVWLDPSQVQPRIDAAVAAGGTLVDDSSAPAFWVLADPEGNRVCLCTWQDR
ncbi:4a-hydroxytetrahydrobiopterin dehydratase [Symbioplanes lichenis]|uniref:4a-hydroxytetrahydrobiopterin dehydratase n=1 Tax=Symbioplanes lichenis TaxID=1629072 RepID=UPI002738226F|nr:4a-hydroxytetrahydrobiopterin dehydratase [Actinoplanes lichenis]